MVLGCSGHYVSELLSMGESGHEIDMALYWSGASGKSVWSLTILYIWQSLVCFRRSTRVGMWLWLYMQVLPVSGPTLEAYSQRKSLEFLQGINISKKKGVPNNCIIFKMGVDESFV